MPKLYDDTVLVCDVEEDNGLQNGKAILFANKPHVTYAVSCALRLDLGEVLAFASESTVVIWCDEKNVGVSPLEDDRLDGTDDMKPFLIHPMPDDDKATSLWLSKRITAFRQDMGLNYVPGESEVDRLLAIADSGTIERDDDSAVILARDMNLVYSGSDLPMPPRHREKQDRRINVNELVFDAWHSRAAVCAQTLARSEAHARARAKAKNKREHCSKCVYECTGRLGDCSVTDAEVVAQYPDSDEARAWMAAFTWSDARLNQGRGHVMAWGPCTTNIHAPLMYVARKLRPPYSQAEDLDPKDVIGEDWQAKIAQVVAKLAARPKEEQARLFWALRQLWAHGHWLYDAKFAQGRGGDKGRRSRNDVLYIRLDHGWRGFDIQIGSDTKASSTGGNYSGRGSTISHRQRPRFRTEYSHPYYEHILDWTGEPLGTKKSSIRLRII